MGIKKSFRAYYAIHFKRVKINAQKARLFSLDNQKYQGRTWMSMLCQTRTCVRQLPNKFLRGQRSFCLRFFRYLCIKWVEIVRTVYFL